MKSFFLLFGLILFLHSSVWAKDDRYEQEIQELKRVVETNNRSLADTVQTLAQIRSDLQILSGEIEAAKHFIDEQRNKGDQGLRDFDYRLTGLEEKLSMFSHQFEEVFTQNSSGGTGSVSDGKTAQTSEEMGEYQKALVEINLKNYKKAVELFEAYLKKYSKSALADNAQYWKGEAYFATKDYAKAILEFEKVNKNFPKSPKRAAAILKQGYALFEMKSYQDARTFLQKIINDFPHSEEASLARERMHKIDQVLAGTAPAAPETMAPPLPFP